MQSNKKLVSAIVIGAGNRGTAYAKYALTNPEDLKIVGVAEPRELRRKKLTELYGIPEDAVFETWEDVAKKEKFADAVLITTLDKMHKDPTIAFANKGYHILLEKPMATTLENCKEIVKACRQNKVMLAVGHVLRYHAHALKIKEIISSGIIGQVVNIQHHEPIGYWHFAHSFVRGNWGNSDRSTFLLLAKCCHDLDLIQMWMGSKDKCKSVASFGSLIHFRKENKPKNASDRCWDCPVEKECLFSAKRLYLNYVSKGHTGWPVDVITDIVDIENVTESLKSGPYGKCAFECDNDVVDNQVVILQYESGATVTLTTTAFTEKVCTRKTTVSGTKGEIKSQFDESYLTVCDFLSDKTSKHELGQMGTGHADCDLYTIDFFVKAIQRNDESLILTGPEESLESHLLCFAAEKARIENRVVSRNEMD